MKAIWGRAGLTVGAAALLALAVSGCNAAPDAGEETPLQTGIPSAPASTQRVAPDEVCDLITAAAVARGDHPASKIAGCFEVEAEDPDHPGFYITRLNAVCEKEVCGSVLIGWYAVEASTGRVFEWDVATTLIGRPVTGPDQPADRKP